MHARRTGLRAGISKHSAPCWAWSCAIAAGIEPRKRRSVVRGASAAIYACASTSRRSAFHGVERARMAASTCVMHARTSTLGAAARVATSRTGRVWSGLTGDGYVCAVCSLRRITRQAPRAAGLCAKRTRQFFRWCARRWACGKIGQAARTWVWACKCVLFRAVRFGVLRFGFCHFGAPRHAKPGASPRPDFEIALEVACFHSLGAQIHPQTHAERRTCTD